MRRIAPWIERNRRAGTPWRAALLWAWGLVDPDNGDPFPPRLLVKGAAEVLEGVRSVEEAASAIAPARCAGKP
jgi:hypothetical protein